MQLICKCLQQCISFCRFCDSIYHNGIEVHGGGPAQKDNSISEKGKFFNQNILVTDRPLVIILVYVQNEGNIILKVSEDLCQLISNVLITEA